MAGDEEEAEYRPPDEGAVKQESERIRLHYETEARRIQNEAEASLSKVLKELEPLRKYETLRDAEAASAA